MSDPASLSDDERHLLAQALLVFAACARDLEGTEFTQRTPDDEWAKFRLLASDYRRAHAAYVMLTGQEPPYPEDAHAALAPCAPSSQAASIGLGSDGAGRAGGRSRP